VLYEPCGWSPQSAAFQTGGMARLTPAPVQQRSTPAIGASFDEVVLPHLAAANRLALWLVRDEHDAEDVVQEALLRAFQYFRTFTEGNGRAWLLSIVRNTCWSWRRRSLPLHSDPFDEERHSDERSVATPEQLLLQSDDAAIVARAMRTLPPRSHRLLLLREVEGLSYRELAAAIEIPIGTVMSRLSRARDALRGAFDETQKAGPDRVPGNIPARRRIK